MILRKDFGKNRSLLQLCLSVLCITITLVGCKKVLVPESVQNQTQELISEYKEDIWFDPTDLPAEDSTAFIEWKENTSMHGDTIIYFFDLVWELEKMDYPIRYRCYTLDDSVIDIQRYRDFALLNKWSSILPPVFKAGEQDWWIDLEEVETVISFEFDKREYVDVDSSQWFCKEQFCGNVSYKNGQLELKSDTLIWNPKENEIYCPGAVEIVSLDSVTAKIQSLLTGSELEANSTMTEYTIKEVKSFSYPE